MVNSSVVPADTYNIVPGNVSKVSIKDLLYSDTTSQATKDATKAFVHFVGWFCTDEDGNTCEGHVKTGYKSDDQSTVDAQLGDIQQRGFDGLVFDWYGPRNQSTSISRIERTANLVRTEIAGTSLQFAIMEDQGAWDGADVCGRTNPSCIQNAIIFDITQAQSEYFSSPNYLTVSGRPVMFFFIIR